MTHGDDGKAVADTSRNERSRSRTVNMISREESAGRVNGVDSVVL
jgi:hypothetical protein